MLDAGGVCVVAMLLRTGRAVKYLLPEAFAHYFDMWKYPKTGFMDAMMQSSIDLSLATLHTTTMTILSTKPLNPAENDDLTITESLR